MKDYPWYESSNVFQVAEARVSHGIRVPFFGLYNIFRHCLRSLSIWSHDRSYSFHPDDTVDIETSLMRVYFIDVFLNWFFQGRSRSLLIFWLPSHPDESSILRAYHRNRTDWVMRGKNLPVFHSLSSSPWWSVLSHTILLSNIVDSIYSNSYSSVTHNRNRMNIVRENKNNNTQMSASY